MEPPGIPALEARGLTVRLGAQGPAVIEAVDLDIARGEILGLVGESGSGKTTAGLALLGYCRRGLRTDGGRVRIAGTELSAMPEAAMGAVRGTLVSYVPQDPVMSMNPMLSIRTQLSEALRPDGQDPDSRIHALLREVGLPVTADFLSRRPHEMSGGQLQRVGIAMAFANRPRLVVMDEPTTGLDVTTQAHVLETIRRLCRDHGVAALYVSHDLAVVAGLCRRIAVMYAGRVVEVGPAAEIVRTPRHPYTRALLRAVPDLARRSLPQGIPGQVPPLGARPPGCSFAPRCETRGPDCTVPPPVQCFGSGHHAACHHPVAGTAAAQVRTVPSVASGTGLLLAVRGLSVFHGRTKVLHDIAFDLPRGACLGIVGESGSGKTTLSRTIGGLHHNWQGEILFKGRPAGARRRDPALRRHIQYVFQNAYSSFNPARTIGQSILSALACFEDLPQAHMRRRLHEMLETVMLPADTAERYPGALSGGQRQRAAIARALIVEPDLMICDEITSALDVSIQARIMEVLAGLQRDRGLTMIFITHNIALLGSVAQQVLVLEKGRIAETGPVSQVFEQPRSVEAQRLLRDTPGLFRPAAGGSSP